MKKVPIKKKGVASKAEELYHSYADVDLKPIDGAAAWLDKAIEQPHLGKVVYAAKAIITKWTELVPDQDKAGLEMLHGAFGLLVLSMKKTAINQCAGALLVGVSAGCIDELLTVDFKVWTALHWYLYAASTWTTAKSFYGKEAVKLMLEGNYPPKSGGFTEVPF